MAEQYSSVEQRIQLAIDAMNTRKNTVRAQIAREFDVPLQRLRFRLKGHPPASAIRGLHNRKLNPDQDLALHTYCKNLDDLGLSVRLHMVERAANELLRQDKPRWLHPPSVGPDWAKRWLDRQLDLHKAKRKPLAAARKNAHDLDLLEKHFRLFKEVVEQYGITPDDTWNFDETGYRMGIARADWIVTRDPVRRIYMKDPDNREFCTAIESISGGGKDIPPTIILTGINLLIPHFQNDIDDDVLFTTSETGYSND